jgi:hypothetical protein
VRGGGRSDRPCDETGRPRPCRRRAPAPRVIVRRLRRAGRGAPEWSSCRAPPAARVPFHRRGSQSEGSRPFRPRRAVRVEQRGAPVSDRRRFGEGRPLSLARGRSGGGGKSWPVLSVVGRRGASFGADFVLWPREPPIPRLCREPRNREPRPSPSSGRISLCTLARRRPDRGVSRPKVGQPEQTSEV